jgi:serine/threonine protein kinase
MEAVSTTYGEPACIKQINQYLLLTAIGEGSFSRVFVARHSETGQIFAVKRVHLKKLAKSSIGVNGIIREIALMSRLSHRNIVTLHEAIYVKATQVVYLVLDYAACGNLASLLKKGHSFSIDILRSIFRQIVSGVGYLHKHGVVHQDLKPSNILLTADGTALISDFGTGHSFQSYARGFGTPAYQAPELINGAVRDEAANAGKEDVWSLGIMLHRLVFGVVPFLGADVFEVARSATSTKLVKPDGADDELWDLIVKMLDPDPSSRFAISDVLEHSWLKGVGGVDVGLPVPDIAQPDEGLPLMVVHGEVLGTDGKYDLPDFTSQPRFRRFEAPFPMEQKRESN